MRYTGTGEQVAAVLTLLRGLRWRAGTTIAILIVAVSSVAAADVGPTYDHAARQSILEDSLHQAETVEQSLEATSFGSISDANANLDAGVQTSITEDAGGAATADRLFAPGVQDFEVNVFVGKSSFDAQLVWRSDGCAAFTITSGHCPSQPGDVMVSSSFAKARNSHVGQTLEPTQAGVLHVVGIYAAPQPEAGSWFDRGSVLFPQEEPCTAAHGCPHSTYDSLFTPKSTLDRLSPATQGVAVDDRPLDLPAVKSSDLDTINHVAVELSLIDQLQQQGIVVESSIPAIVQRIQSSWRSLSVPVVIVTLELLVLVWMLLFLIITDAIEARGTDIALAKLRGLPGWRVLRFALAEPVALLVVAIPIGAIIGWVASILQARILLRSGTSVELTGLGWLAAAGASVGGLVAVVAGAQATVRRPVVDQWRRTARHATRRAWVLDAVIATLAIAGIAQIVASGDLGSAKHNPIALLVPGLLGLTVAVISSRLLPVLSRSGFAATRRGGRLSAYLAVRHIGRRPAGVRTTAILATAIALATFGVASWNVGRMNRARYADLTVGAPTVLTVSPTGRQPLATTVDAIDPSGTKATAVEESTSGGALTIAVEPQRFARIASWSSADVADAARLLQPLEASTSVPPPIELQGTKLRVTVSTKGIRPSDISGTLDIVSSTATAPTPLALGEFPNDSTVTRTVVLPGDGDQLQDLQLAPAKVQSIVQPPLSGTLTISKFEELVGGRWRPVAAVERASQWTTATGTVSDAGGPAALTWHFTSSPNTNSVLTVNDHPAALPAVIPSALNPGQIEFNATGLDGNDLPVAVSQRVESTPGAPGDGVIVDLDSALRASFGVQTSTVFQVWVDGDPQPIIDGLAARKIAVLSSQSSSTMNHELSRQGPGLASVVFLADAFAAAILAAFGAILSLVTAARRRRYEYAALSTAGVPRKTLYAALVLEQLVIVGFAAVVGLAGGIISTLFVESAVPEFVNPPSGIVLHYSPSVGIVAAVIGGSIVVLLVATAVTARLLLRSIGVDRLRAGPA